MSASWLQEPLAFRRRTSMSTSYRNSKGLGDQQRNARPSHPHRSGAGLEHALWLAETVAKTGRRAGQAKSDLHRAVAKYGPGVTTRYVVWLRDGEQDGEVRRTNGEKYGINAGFADRGTTTVLKALPSFVAMKTGIGKMTGGESRSS